jgi:hypothetical protein
MSQKLLNNLLVAIEETLPFEERFDISFWDELTFDEKNVATNALINAAKLGNTCAIMTLGDLGDKRFLEVIRAQSLSPDEWVRLSANRALLKLVGSTDGLLSSIKEGTMLSRFASVMDLSKTSGEKVETAILAALEDKNPYVRTLAFESLIERFDLLSLTKNKEGLTLLQSPLMVLNSLLLADLGPLWEKGSSEAKQVFTFLNKGTRPDQLNLKYIQDGPENFVEIVRDSFFNKEEPFDTTLIKRTKGHNRVWAETFLCLQLHIEVRDPRAVEALRELKAYWTVPALEASCSGLSNTDPYFALAQLAISELSD